METFENLIDYYISNNERSRFSIELLIKTVIISSGVLNLEPGEHTLLVFQEKKRFAPRQAHYAPEHVWGILSTH